MKPENTSPPPAGRFERWRARFVSQLPKRHDLAAHPWLAPVAERVLHPQLWHVRHEAVARGLAVGVFWAFTLPVAQILAAAVHCIWWRGNIPSAAAATFITNPFTVGFWLWLAHGLGGMLLGQNGPTPALRDVGLMQWLLTEGQPTLLGMGIFAVGGALATYWAVRLVWRLRVILKRAKRR
jgi:uncharacterized protein